MVNEQGRYTYQAVSVLLVSSFISAIESVRVNVTSVWYESVGHRAIVG